MKTLVIFAMIISSGVCIAQQSDAIHYTSLNTAIYLGAYGGSKTAKEVKQHGDFDLGSEERLVGELVLPDGIMYTTPSSGKTKVINPDANIH